MAVKCKNEACSYTSPNDVGDECPRCSQPFEKAKKEAPEKEPYYSDHKGTLRKK